MIKKENQSIIALLILLFNLNHPPEKQKRPVPCQPCMPKPHEKEKKKRAGPWMRTGIIHLNYG